MPFNVEVITTRRDDPTVITDRRIINYDNSQRRKWLAKHSNWALRNGLAVHTAAVVPDQPAPARRDDDLVTLTRGQLREMLDRIVNPPAKLTGDQMRHAIDQMRDMERRYLR